MSLVYFVCIASCEECVRFFKHAILKVDDLHLSVEKIQSVPLTSYREDMPMLSNYPANSVEEDFIEFD